MKARMRSADSPGVWLRHQMPAAGAVGAGDELGLVGRGMRPPARGGFSHQQLDELRHSIALAVVQRHTPRQIRAQILANLHRWKAGGTWGRAYQEWLEVARGEDDRRLFAVMLGRDEEAVRLRQSAPFVGLLSREEVMRLNERAAG